MTGFYWVLQCLIEFRWLPIGFHWVLPSFTWFYLVFLGSAGCDRVFIKFYLDLLIFTEFYQVLLGFTGFYYVQQGFEGVQWVSIDFYLVLPSFT